LFAATIRRQPGNGPGPRRHMNRAHIHVRTASQFGWPALAQDQAPLIGRGKIATGQNSS
jgi:hypothetical protein